MKDPIIDDTVKAYLVACLVSGIQVESDPHFFMTGLVDHMNSLVERVFWATGDEDGVILHDKHDLPILSLIYDGTVLKFALFDNDEFLQQGINRNAGLMLLNILGYIRDQGLECVPAAMMIDKTVVPPPSQDTQDDWSL